jgi:hypothetical protein
MPSKAQHLFFCNGPNSKWSDESWGGMLHETVTDSLMRKAARWIYDRPMADVIPDVLIHEPILTYR